MGKDERERGEGRPAERARERERSKEAMTTTRASTQQQQQQQQESDNSKRIDRSCPRAGSFFGSECLMQCTGDSATFVSKLWLKRDPSQATEEAPFLGQRGRDSLAFFWLASSLLPLSEKERGRNSQSSNSSIVTMPPLGALALASRSLCLPWRARAWRQRPCRWSGGCERRSLWKNEGGGKG